MHKIRKISYYLIIAVLLCVFGYSGWQLYSYYRESAQTQAGYDELSQLRQEGTRPTQPERPTEPTAPPSTDPTTPTETELDPYAGLIHMTDSATGKEAWMLPEFCQLFAINPDIIGWIRLEGTRVDYPVVHSPERKDYYLHRDFYGNQGARGCIYLREECDPLTSDNLTLYGHMMKDGTMFADLAGYTERRFWESHPHIRFDTLREPGLYEVICVFKTSATIGMGFRYHLYEDFEDEAHLAEFWEECTSRQFYDTGLTPVLGDKLITLSTCEYTLENGRLVIVARKVDS